MRGMMASEGIIPCSHDSFDKLKAAISDADMLDPSLVGIMLEVDWVNGDIPKGSPSGAYLYCMNDLPNMEVIQDSNIPAVVGGMLKAAGMRGLVCSLEWGHAPLGSIKGSRFRFLDDGTIEQEYHFFPKDEWLWACPECGKTIVHTYDALVEVGSPICDSPCDTEMERCNHCWEPDEYISKEECIADGVHLSNCDDGFCNRCGHQDD